MSVVAIKRPGIATHYLRYLSSNVLVVAAGFISFPMLTRLLDNHQFGLLGYYEAWLALIASVLKLGSQHAILRLYPHAGSSVDLACFRSNHVLLPFALSMSLWVCCAALAWMLAARLPQSEHTLVLLLLLTIPVMIWCSLVEAVMYALERSDITLWMRTAWRWSELALVIATLVFVERSASGVLGAKLAVYAVVALGLTWWFRGWLRAPWVRPSRTLLVTGLAFGVPMMFNELTYVLFGFADRILLRWLTGSLVEVGVYSVGYGLAMAVGTIFGATLNQAFTPTAVRRFETEGPAAVVALKRNMLDAWIAVVALASAWMLVAGGDFFILLAGPDKLRSAPIFVIVALCVIWYSLFEIAQYGLLLERRASRFLLLTMAAALFNLVACLPLIMRWGVIGAAAATALAYALLAYLQYRNCPRELRYLPPPLYFVLALAFPIGTYSAIHGFDHFGADNAWQRLIVGSLAVLLPGVLLVATVKPLREGLLHLLRQRRGAVA